MEWPANSGHLIQHCGRAMPIRTEQQRWRNRRHAKRLRFSRPACTDLSISERRARKHDVGADSEPEGVVAHDRYLDEHAKDRQDHHDERSNKPKVHCTYLPRLR